ncbi:50S ribosomal protein L15 [Patescibacteria group bacterium]|nr:50S ribosomal protein L15 [Patescibacteria group bacterium]
MQIHEIRSTKPRKKRKRIGRGGKRGTYSGRGMKGQKSRAGAKMQPLVREFLKRYPKLRGYRVSGTSAKRQAINIEILERMFEAGETVNPAVLVEKKAVRRIAGRAPLVKILGNGELKKALTIERCEVSESAKEKIEKAGGTVAPVQ